MRLTPLALAVLLAGTSASAQEMPWASKAVKSMQAASQGTAAGDPDAKVHAAQPAEPAAPPVKFAECTPLPKPRAGALPFPGGESLEFDIDVMGVRAGKMTLDVLPFNAKSAKEIPVRVRAESNTFFTKVRKTKAEATSYLDARDLKPRRFREDLSEGTLNRIANVTFAKPERKMHIEWKGNIGTGRSSMEVAPDALDYLGAMYLFRTVELSVGQSFCFDVYAMRRAWRVEGKVEAREHVSAPAGEFDAFHLSGMATRMGPGKQMKREVHVWISDDARRLPIAAVGVIDLGPVRATLSGVSRPDFKTAAARPRSMEW